MLCKTGCLIRDVLNDYLLLIISSIKEEYLYLYIYRLSVNVRQAERFLIDDTLFFKLVRKRIRMLIRNFEDMQNRVT